MKNIYLFSFLITLLSFTFYAQNGGEYIPNKQNEPCLSNNHRKLLHKEVKKNIALLSSQNKLIAKSTEIVLFDWPLKVNVNSGFNEGWAISNYVDHNAAFPNQIQDYNCGNKSYDTTSGYNHQGIDMYTWPFSWYQLDNNISEIIAAQDGQIIFKSDGNFDRSCALNNNQWNAVFVRHSDNSTAWYGHMKSGSLTTKIVGDTVVKGEFLGIVGSSGNSTGPHLHFEVYNSSNNLIDPYAGACNNLNADSWWFNQRTYVDPNINAVLTHSSPPVFNACSVTETTNLSNNFVLNDQVIVAFYLRDQIAGTIADLKIIRPNNTTFAIWNHNLNDNFESSFWWWQTPPVDQIGTWQCETTYQGQTITHNFEVEAPVSVTENTLNNTVIYPNPFNENLNIKTDQNITKVIITNLLGKTIKTIENQNINTMQLANHIEKGIYFISLETKKNIKKTFTVIKQ